jgi:DNA-binding NarL/FixJ family response regulator
VQRILILDHLMLVGAGIQTFLTGEADLDVIGISPDNQESLAQEVNRLRPDVIILDEASRLAGPIKLMFLLKDMPKLRIVLISANDNRVRIFRKEETQLCQATDIFGIIREESLNGQSS